MNHCILHEKTLISQKNYNMENDRWTDLLKRHDIRPTANRLMVAKMLATAQRPLSLTELEMMSLTIDKSNIFRRLSRRGNKSWNGSN